MFLFQRGINEFVTVESSSLCDKMRNIEDENMIEVGDDVITIKVSHDIFDTTVPLVNGVEYKGDHDNIPFPFNYSST